MIPPPDIDESDPGRAARAPQASLAIALAAGLLATVGLWTDWSETAIGLLLALALGAIGVGLITWAKDLPVDHEAIQLLKTWPGPRPTGPSSAPNGLSPRRR